MFLIPIRIIHIIIAYNRFIVNLFLKNQSYKTFFHNSQLFIAIEYQWKPLGLNRGAKIDRTRRVSSFYNPAKGRIRVDFSTHLVGRKTSTKLRPQPVLAAYKSSLGASSKSIRLPWRPTNDNLLLTLSLHECQLTLAKIQLRQLNQYRLPLEILPRKADQCTPLSLLIGSGWPRTPHSTSH